LRLRARRALVAVLRHLALLDREDRLAVGAVQEVHPTGLAGLHERLHRLAADLRVEQDHRVGAVVVPDVVVDLLEVPAMLAGLGVDRDDRGGEQVVARAQVADVVRRGVPGREVQKAQLRVDGRRLPDGSAAGLVGVVVRPALVSDLTGAGHGPEAPVHLAGLGIERRHPPADLELPARDAGVDTPVVVERRRGDGLAVLPATDARSPLLLARALVECDERPVELP
jgi:hypothetical protein